MPTRLATLFLLAAVGGSVAVPAGAQQPLGVFPGLVGAWEGPAWIVMGPDGRHDVLQREWVREVAGGTVITVQGIGKETSVDGTERTVHDAFAVIHLDRDRATPLMRAYTSAGNWQDMDLTLRDDGYDWGMDDPRAGRIRYEARFSDDGLWTEKGYMTRDDGKTWIQFFEMNLRRTN
jgi:hypothetical protein